MKALPTSIGRYQIRDRIGQGGMGVLYLALDPALDRLLAIKVLRTQDDDVHERFIREAKSAGRLQHPNVITIYDVGEHDGQPFIAMEYIAGETLAEMIKRRAALPVGRKLELIEELCHGLEFAHRAGIIHRDVKPSNVMVNRDGVLKVLDFGIARVADSSHTQAGVMMGTPSYMAPEQIENARVDLRADIFAVGAVAYEFISGQQAFSDTNHLAILRKVLSEQPAPLDSLVPGLDPEVPRIIGRALEKSPTDRYQDLAAMSADIARLRARLAEGTNERTIVETPRPIVTPTPVRRMLGREDLVKLRREQTDRHLRTAASALERNDLDEALRFANEAALLDPDYPPTLELIAKIQSALDERARAGALDDVERQLRQGALTEAIQLLDGLEPGRSRREDGLRERVSAAVEERERERDRSRRMKLALEHGQQSLARGAPESAIRAADEALAYLPTSEAARDLKRRAQQLVADREREALEARVSAVVAEARAQFARGQREQALERLSAFRPPHPRVNHELETLRAELVALQDAEARELRYDEPHYPDETVADLGRTVADVGEMRTDEGGTLVDELPQPSGSAATRTRLAGLAIAVALLAAVGGLMLYRSQSVGGRRATAEVAQPEVRRDEPPQPPQLPQTETGRGAPPPETTTKIQQPEPITSDKPAPTPEPIADARDTEALNQSRRLLAAGQLNEAVALAAQTRRRRPDLPAARTAIVGVIEAARARAITARNGANDVQGASEIEAYRTAESRVALGERARQTIDEAAVGHYLDAERGYLQATADARTKLAANQSERELAAWVNSRLAQARTQAAAQNWSEAQQTYQEIKARAPQTPGLDTLIADLNRQRAAAELQQWATRQVSAVEQAIAKQQWGDAERLTAELRQRAPATAGIVDLQSQIERGRTAAANGRGSLGTGGANVIPTKPADENPAIEAVLRQFGQGYSQQSLGAMKQAWPSMPASTADTYQRSFDSHSWQQWQFDRTSISVDGSTAAAACEVRISQQGIRERQPQTERRKYRITLRKSASGWEIMSLQFDGSL